MSVKLYRLLCQHCNWRRITDGSDVSDLVEIKQSKIQQTLPKLDSAGKFVESKFVGRSRKFRCPKCGHVVIPHRISNPQAQIDEKNEELNVKNRNPDGHQEGAPRPPF